MSKTKVDRPKILSSSPTPRPINANGKQHAPNGELPDNFWDIDETAVLHSPPGFCYEIALDMFFNAQHHVIMDGQPGVLHAHSYRVQVCCQSQTLATKEHVVIGYYTLRKQVESVVKAYNNQILNNLPPFARLQPTTENLVAVLFQQLTRILAPWPVALTSLTVWESPTEAVTYRVDKW